MTSWLTSSELITVLGGYVLEALEPEEAAAVRAHLTAARPAPPSTRAGRAAGDARLAARLDAAAEPPPPGSRSELLDPFARETRRAPPRRRRSPPPRFGLAAAARRIASAVVAAARGAGISRSTAAASRARSRGYGVRLKPGRAPGASARAGLDGIPGGTEVHLWARGLAGDPRGLRDAAARASGSSASAGTFRADACGRASTSSSAPPRARGVRARSASSAPRRRADDGRAHRRPRPDSNQEDRCANCRSSPRRVPSWHSRAAAATTRSTGGSAEQRDAERRAAAAAARRSRWPRTRAAGSSSTRPSSRPGRHGHDRRSTTRPTPARRRDRGQRRRGGDRDHPPGAKPQVSADLEAGEYTFYCPVGNHRGAGMEGTLTVK